MEHDAYLTTPRFINRGETGIPISNVKPLLKFAQADGIDTQSLLLECGIQATEFCYQDRSILLSQYLDLIQRIRLEITDPCYALKLGEQFFINHDGVLACRIMASNTVAEAMTLLCRYQVLFTQMFQFQFSIHKGVGVFEVGPSQALTNTNEHAIQHFIEYIYGAIFNLGKFCLGTDQIDLDFEFTVNKGEYARPFKHYFGNQVTFAKKNNRVLIPEKTLNSKIIYANVEAAEYHEKLCKRFLMKYESDELIIKQVKQVIRSMSFNQITLERLANKLHLSPRSLRRHLKNVGVSYKALFETERKRQAIKQVQLGNIALDKLAEELGYQNTSSFSRAFKRWFGLSPQQYKDNHQTLPRHEELF
ncbi:AraC family transcriptional regulator [Bermanella marisrubri]|uniref:AraC-type DNA-binding domain-containing protein n=1 Tax=Bermanella marisrubri TaxID=207949 RepID=Q1N1T2_9GAMM|nr:AraC family transcriptional regulator [Bermanella marisrubri]EAT12199.1 AraC-type DNA-binding domain-containing protein [Oceanobacter sp. RED65] [Bermanella marisrubri]QIZ83671.1 AraC family transcriptional regulator [Bermanella marisrubri]